ncbi:MAG: hypothetical protein HZC02_01735 [Candidatus Levybacteria bacterium]|nr:hypothetical protein [Candidatus Levybacteria bacterium]
MKKLFIYYNFILVSIITILGFLQAQSSAEIISAILFFPFFIYFFRLVLPQQRKAVPLVTHTKIDAIPLHIEIKKIFDETEETISVDIEPIGEGDENTEAEADSETDNILNRLDIDRRMFLKLIGSAGITVFLFSLFTKRAQGAFFGSVPGPGTVAIKDTTGAKIDPAIKQPTDGYTLAQLDDSSSTAYYGYLNKDSAWYILKEDSSGNYRYVKGSSSFSTNWTNRASLTYDYFDAVF